MAEATGGAAECLVCLQGVHPTDLITLPCGCHYCKLCLNHSFESATLDESMFPPSCEHGPIDLASVRTFVFRAVATAYEAKAPEFSTPNRTYCHEPTCSTWIPPNSIQGKAATCPTCARTTCAFCKQKLHEDDCADDPAVRSLMVTAQREGYQTCTQCRRLIERSAGCNHI